MEGFTELADQGGSTRRKGNPFVTMCTGFLAVPAVIFLMFKNELHYVKSMATADLIGDAADASYCQVLDHNFNSLVFASCEVNAPDIASHLPPVLTPWIKKYKGASLEWAVEIFQWSEHRSESCTEHKGGHKTCHTRYTHSKGWSGSLIDSNSFVHRSGHENHGSLPSNLHDGKHEVPPYTIELWDPRQSLSSKKGFVLNQDLQNQLPTHTVMPGTLDAAFLTTTASPPNATANGKGPAQSGLELTPAKLNRVSNYLTTGSDVPQIGDVRVVVRGKTSQFASVCAKQTRTAGNEASLEAFPPQPFDFWGHKTHALERLDPMVMKKEDMEELAKSESLWLVRITRLLCFLAMAAAFNCIFSPLSAMADLLRYADYVTCCLGSILAEAANSIICCVSCSSACFCFIFSFCVCWSLANPSYSLTGLIVLIGMSLAGYAVGQKFKKAKGREPFAQTSHMKVGLGNYKFIVPV